LTWYNIQLKGLSDSSETWSGKMKKPFQKREAVRERHTQALQIDVEKAEKNVLLSGLLMAQW
jgi:hypothetical protein